MSLTGSRFPCLFVVEKGVKRLFDCLFDLLLVLIIDEWIFGTARILCGAWSMKRYRVRLSVSLSVRLSQHGPHSMQQVCCCGPGGQDISIDFCSSGGRMRAVPRCQRTYAAEHRLVLRLVGPAAERSQSGPACRRAGVEFSQSEGS